MSPHPETEMATNPLATFTPAVGCARPVGPVQIPTSTFSVTRPFFLAGPQPTNTGCFPMGYNPASSFFYSPVPACPTGFTSACAAEQAAGTVTDTAIVCCPTQYAFGCVQDPFRPPPFDTLRCSMASTSTFVGSSTATDIDIVAFGIQIRYQSSDLSPPATGAPQPTATSGSNTSSTAALSTAAAASGPSLGAAVGISIFATLGILALFGAAFYLGRRNRRRRDEARTSVNEQMGEDGSYESGGGMYGSEAGNLSIVPSPGPAVVRYEDSPLGTVSEWKASQYGSSHGSSVLGTSPELPGESPLGEVRVVAELDGAGERIRPP